MRLNKLLLNKFGPFRKYEIDFIDEDKVCILLTGKNNEGKTTLINALKFIDKALKVLNKRKQKIFLNDNQYFRLFHQDVENVNIGRLVYNYESTIATIKAIFIDNFEVIVYIDPENDMIYADYSGKVPYDADYIFGFIPPLGPLAEDEDILTKTSYIKANFNTSLAPRHLRNHFYQILSENEFSLISKIINASWEDIKFLDYERDYSSNKIYCYYKEKNITREISWAGQGLQVWFQIITHMVRLRNTSILILDEPEINLYPEKQNELIRILRDYYHESIIIATHSVELINNVNISHIINVQKNQKKPKIKTTTDRTFLEIVRSQIGSNFNFIASQFEEVDIIIFTEDKDDFFIIDSLAKGYGIKKRAFNIPFHGFSEHKKSIAYKDAYNLLIGKPTLYTLLLDRDYYPEEYLNAIKEKINEHGIRTVFTLGKEIENIFLSPILLKNFITEDGNNIFSNFIEELYKSEHFDCKGNFISLHENFLPSKQDIKSIIKTYLPMFEENWNDKNVRRKLIAGKNALKKIRHFFKSNFNITLTTHILIEELLKIDNQDIKDFIESVYQTVENQKISNGT